MQAPFDSALGDDSNALGHPKLHRMHLEHCWCDDPRSDPVTLAPGGSLGYLCVSEWKCGIIYWKPCQLRVTFNSDKMLVPIHLIQNNFIPWSQRRKNLKRVNADFQKKKNSKMASPACETVRKHSKRLERTSSDCQGRTSIGKDAVHEIFALKLRVLTGWMSLKIRSNIIHTWKLPYDKIWPTRVWTCQFLKRSSPPTNKVFLGQSALRRRSWVICASRVSKSQAMRGFWMSCSSRPQVVPPWVLDLQEQNRSETWWKLYTIHLEKVYLFFEMQGTTNRYFSIMIFSSPLCNYCTVIDTECTV